MDSGDVYTPLEDTRTHFGPDLRVLERDSSPLPPSSLRQGSLPPSQGCPDTSHSGPAPGVHRKTGHSVTSLKCRVCPMLHDDVAEDLPSFYTFLYLLDDSVSTRRPVRYPSRPSFVHRRRAEDPVTCSGGRVGLRQSCAGRNFLRRHKGVWTRRGSPPFSDY